MYPLHVVYNHIALHKGSVSLVDQGFLLVITQYLVKAYDISEAAMRLRENGTFAAICGGSTEKLTTTSFKWYRTPEKYISQESAEVMNFKSFLIFDSSLQSLGFFFVCG